MASDKGESVSFTAFYYQNLTEIKQLLIYLKKRITLQFVFLRTHFTY